jgi:hypothetical protein
LPLGQENHSVLSLFPVGVMVFAVFKFGNFEGDFLRCFLGFFADGVEFLPQFLVPDDLILNDGSDFFVFVKVVHHHIFGVVHNPRTDVCIPQLVFSLAFEDGFFDFDGNGTGHPFPDIHPAIRFLKKLVYPFEDPFPEGALVCSSVTSVLAVDKTEISLAVVVRMGKGELDAFSPEVGNLV